jgi:hypothetical protein
MISATEQFARAVDAVCSQGNANARRRTLTELKHIMDARRDHLKEALTAQADALAKHPAEEILFDWFRSGRLVGELSVLIKRGHPEVQAEIDRAYREHLAKLGKKAA